MRALSPGLIAAVAKSSLVKRDFVRCDFAEGTFGYSNLLHDTSIDSIVYQGVGGLGQIESVSLSASDVIGSLRLTLSGAAPETVAVARTFTSFGRPMSYTIGLFDADTSAVVGFIPVFAGIMDRIAVVEQVEGQSVITLQCEGDAYMLTRASGATRSSADQRAFDADDLIFRHVSGLKQRQIYWGQRTPAQGARRSRR